ncbi:uncharacterized protein I206_101093 [Kwoniella pini CBS 10737]|uniref:Uncharacterized protein n=1 Tax=Kwoniella pini CBS 10737 TaxID=1296096 RepID=A0A1B9IBX5_9TREE|nr:uncharacterized protein I206_00234 [Kwoniella pini CBS 10737]OCF52933.1 hypothetical protein I206_00234 [Kwoniella pini CBS 10737]
MINESEHEATTSNYFQVAISDDQHAIENQDYQNESLTKSKAEKAEIRKQRIEAAVKKSKIEYKSEHAYTERDWFLNSDIERNVLSKPKVDKQHLEYITTSLYYASPPKYQEALNLILKGFDPNSKKPLGGLTRELLDIALRCSLKIEDIDNSIKLVDSSRNLWKGQYAGIAALASDVYILLKKPKDALIPLLISTSSFGLHEPILNRLSKIIQELINKNDNLSNEFKATKHFLNILYKVIIWKSNYLQKPLFNDSPNIEKLNLNNSLNFNGIDMISLNNSSDIDISFDKPIDIPSIILELNLNVENNNEDLLIGLNGTVNRLNKGLKSEIEGESQIIEKSVREL